MGSPVRASATTPESRSSSQKLATVCLLACSFEKATIGASSSSDHEYLLICVGLLVLMGSLSPVDSKGLNTFLLLCDSAASASAFHVRLRGIELELGKRGIGDR